MGRLQNLNRYNRACVLGLEIAQTCLDIRAPLTLLILMKWDKGCNSMGSLDIHTFCEPSFCAGSCLFLALPDSMFLTIFGLNSGNNCVDDFHFCFVFVL